MLQVGATGIEEEEEDRAIMLMPRVDEKKERKRVQNNFC
jgi:hypothetical protein